MVSLNTEIKRPIPIKKKIADIILTPKNGYYVTSKFKNQSFKSFSTPLYPRAANPPPPNTLAAPDLNALFA